MPIRSLCILLLSPILAMMGWAILTSLMPEIQHSSIQILISPLLLFLLPSLLVSPKALTGYAPKAWRELLNISIDSIPLRGLSLVVGLVCLLPMCALSVAHLSELIVEWLGLGTYLSPIDSVEEGISKLIGNDELPIWFCILGFCILPAICEELYFRHSLQGTLKEWLSSNGTLLSIAITSCIFSLLHFSAIGFLARFTLSVLLGYIYDRTHSLVLVSSLHACNNLLALLLMQTTNYNY